MTTSADPNETSGRAATAISSLTFPLTEAPTLKTRIKFLKYSRLNPASLPTLETTAVVTLPMPMFIPDSIATSINRVNLGLAGNINMQSALNTYTGSGGGAAGLAAVGNDMVQQGQSAYSNYIKGLGGSNGFMKALHDLAVAPKILDNAPGGLSQLAQRSLGVIQNPHTNAFFEGMDLRTFSLSWQMSPRSAQEANALTSIKDLIKERITPEESINGFALDYPDLCEIEFVGDAAKHLAKIHRCFVTRFTAVPRGGNTMAFYEDGAPVEQEFTMDLMELNIMTRNKLREDKQG